MCVGLSAPLVSIDEREELPVSNITVEVYDDEVDTMGNIHEEAIRFCKLSIAWSEPQEDSE
jgi:hypothetical protein